jgi:hypothetical protein
MDRASAATCEAMSLLHGLPGLIDRERMTCWRGQLKLRSDGHAELMDSRRFVQMRIGVP